jgi:tRNA pseudouridine38-40 synthase
MSNYRITVKYDGARYRGWQRLGRDAGGDSITSKLESVFSQLCDEEIRVIGSGRTDAGVHALAQVANFHSERRFSGRDILEYSARYLPDDIAVTSAEEVDERFHARYQAKEKTYLYRIDTGLYPDPFQRKYAWHITEPLDYHVMRDAALMLTGRHDFSGFSSMKSKTKSTERTLSLIDIQESDPGKSAEGDFTLIRFIGEGFLHNMVRIITGTLVEVGLGSRSVDTIPVILKNGKRAEAGSRAPAKGLFLESVRY